MTSLADDLPWENVFRCALITESRFRSRTHPGRARTSHALLPRANWLTHFRFNETTSVAMGHNRTHAPQQTASIGRDPTYPINSVAVANSVRGIVGPQGLRGFEVDDKLEFGSPGWKVRFTSLLDRHALFVWPLDNRIGNQSPARPFDYSPAPEPRLACRALVVKA